MTDIEKREKDLQQTRVLSSTFFGLCTHIGGGGGRC